jgi:hypothetical protein
MSYIFICTRRELKAFTLKNIYDFNLTKANLIHKNLDTGMKSQVLHYYTILLLNTPFT